MLNVVLPNTVNTFAAMADALVARGYGPANRKYLIAAEMGNYCGLGETYPDDRPQAINYNNGNAPAMFASVSAMGGCWVDTVAAHELLHTLGAVQATAPNATDYGHCTDEWDVMCYRDGPSTVELYYPCPKAHENLIDCNHDDYFSTNPPVGNYLRTHWNTATSAFLDPGGKPSVPFTPLGVSAAPRPGSATVTWDAPAYDGGSPITGYVVTASPGGANATASPSARSIVVPRLVDGVAVTFTVRAYNALGRERELAPERHGGPDPADLDGGHVLDRVLPEWLRGVVGRRGLRAGADERIDREDRGQRHQDDRGRRRAGHDLPAGRRRARLHAGHPGRRRGHPPDDRRPLLSPTSAATGCGGCTTGSSRPSPRWPASSRDRWPSPPTGRSTSPTRPAARCARWWRRATCRSSPVAANAASAVTGVRAPRPSIGWVTGLVADPAGNLYIADQDNMRVRRLTPGGTITTVLGTGAADQGPDGLPAAQTAISFPYGVSWDAGRLYVVSSTSVRVVGTDGLVRTWVGFDVDPGDSGDGGPASLAQLQGPADTAVVGGRLLILDGHAHKVRRVESPTITTLTVPSAPTAFTATRGRAGCGADVGASVQRRLAADRVPPLRGARSARSSTSPPTSRRSRCPT